MKRLLFVLLVCIPIGTWLLHTSSAAPADESASQKAQWQRMRGLAGTWTGTGQPDDSRVEQSYELILNDKFLLARTKSVTEKETHEDWEILSYDAGRGKVVLRQFVSEGFVNQYVLDEVSDDGRNLVFVSESCENAPPGFRTRQTYTIQDDNHMSQQLELAPPNQEFSGCASNKLSRKK